MRTGYSSANIKRSPTAAPRPQASTADQAVVDLCSSSDEDEVVAVDPPPPVQPDAVPSQGASSAPPRPDAVKSEFQTPRQSYLVKKNANTADTAIEIDWSDSEDETSISIVKNVAAASRYDPITLSSDSSDDEEYRVMGAAPEASPAKVKRKKPTMYRLYSSDSSEEDEPIESVARMPDKQDSSEEDSSDDELARRRWSRKFSGASSVGNRPLAVPRQPAHAVVDEKKPAAKRKQGEIAASNFVDLCGDSSAISSTSVPERGNMSTSLQSSSVDSKTKLQATRPLHQKAKEQSPSASVGTRETLRGGLLAKKVAPRARSATHLTSNKAPARNSLLPAKRPNDDFASSRRVPKGSMMRSKFNKPRKAMKAYSEGDMIPLGSSQKRVDKRGRRGRSPPASPKPTFSPIKTEGGDVAPANDSQRDKKSTVEGRRLESEFDKAGDQSEPDSLSGSESCRSALVSPTDPEAPASRTSDEQLPRDSDLAEKGELSVASDLEEVFSDTTAEEEEVTGLSEKTSETGSRYSSPGDTDVSSTDLDAAFVDPAMESRSPGFEDRQARKVAQLLEEAEAAASAAAGSRRKRRPNYVEKEQDDLEMSKSQMYLDAESDSGVLAKASTRDYVETVPSPMLSRPKRASRIKAEKKREESDRVSETDDGADYGAMEEISHLARYSLDERTGYPSYRFSVINHSDETIYDFKVFVAPSSIPNSGLGAHLTFLGARELTKSAFNKAAERFKRRLVFVPDTMQPLEAVGSGGFGINVKLTGRNLHRNHNHVYIPETAWPLDAKLPGNKKVKLHLHGKRLHYDESDEEDEPLNPTRLGFHKMHTASDYVHNPKRTFSFNQKGCTLIDIGRYGPVLKDDRKTTLQYDTKNFIFSYEPSGWGFGVTENVHHHTQVVDITDDATGEPHKKSRSLIPIHVNEVGHNKSLTQNVISLEKDSRAIHYYLKLTEPINCGETVELFTDYYSPYESVRERKGYGKANIKKGEKGDDHEPTALLRNFHERDLIVEMIEARNLWEIFSTLEFIVERILDPIVELTDSFIEDIKSNGCGTRSCKKPTPLQWKARRRIDWLSSHFKNRIEALKGKRASFAQGFPFEGILRQCQKWSAVMKWGKFSEFMELRSGFVNAGCKNIHVSMDAELREEILYKLEKKFPMPLDERMWCHVARTLIRKLCVHTAESLIKPGSSLDRLALAYSGLARKAAEQVKDCCAKFKNGDGSRRKILFESNLPRPSVASASSLSSFPGFKANGASFWGHSNVPKSTSSSLVDVMAYRDALEVGFLPEQFDVSKLEVKLPDSVVILKPPVAFGEDGESKSTDIYGIPRSSDWALGSPQAVNESWYLVWQVVYVTHTFALEYLADSEQTSYSLEQLCEAVGVDLSAAKKALQLGITKFSAPPIFDPGTSQEKLKKQLLKNSSNAGAKKKKSSAGSGQKTSIIIWEGLVLKELKRLGWSVDTGTRPRDFYYLPPGVQRCRGFSNRKDYFDSQKLVMDFLRRDKRWKDNPDIVTLLQEADACQALYVEQRAKRSLPKGGVTIEWLLSHLDGGSA